MKAFKFKVVKYMRDFGLVTRSSTLICMDGNVLERLYAVNRGNWL